MIAKIDQVYSLHTIVPIIVAVMNLTSAVSLYVGPLLNVLLLTSQTKHISSLWMDDLDGVIPIRHSTLNVRYWQHVADL